MVRCGENIASGQRTVEEAMASWLDSPGHCANIMNPDFREMGAAYAINPQNQNRTAYWTQEFGSRPEVTRASAPDTSADDNVAGGATADVDASGG